MFVLVIHLSTTIQTKTLKSLLVFDLSIFVCSTWRLSQRGDVIASSLRDWSTYG